MIPLPTTWQDVTLRIFPHGTPQPPFGAILAAEAVLMRETGGAGFANLPSGETRRQALIAAMLRQAQPYMPPKPR